ncbi:uncharacterized mitochondrial protein AtMg00810-like, partial [Telopea speciosissima]|uniref:uncharacterized mitochondrial protein AtMg00810-like n=1 Tax=Telopea speciosissima TaxID=54955 RepID=UPI001CC574E7
DSKVVVMVVYVDDIIISGNDTFGIAEVKAYLHQHFQIKDLGTLKYFLGSEVLRSKKGISLSQRKYVLDLLIDTRMLTSKPTNTPMDPHQKLGSDEGEDFSDVHRYKRLFGKLIYLTVTCPYISFAVGVISQFMQCPKKIHWDAACRVLRYLKSALGKGLIYRPNRNANLVGFSDVVWAGADGERRSTSGYCTFVGGNLVTWKSKKQTTFAQSSVEAEYRVMAHTTAELICVKSLLQELGFPINQPMQMFCNNQAAIYILIVTPFVSTTNQLGDMFTKALFGPTFR